MSGSNELVLWLHEYKMAALSSVLEEQGSTVEKRMQEALLDLYAELVPQEVQQEIRTRIDTEYAAEQAAIEAAKQYAVFCVRADGTEQFFQSGQSEDFLVIGKFLRQYLREASESGAAELKKAFPDLTPVSDGQYSQMVISHLEHVGNVTGVFELDFDKREVSTIGVGGKWQTYSMKDVSSAVHFAYRKSSLLPEQYNDRFEARLSGKAYPSAGHLSAQDVSFKDEIYEMDGLLNFYMDTSFDVDEVLGMQGSAAPNGGWINIYANYDITAEQVCDTLEIVLHCGDGSDKEMSYPLNTVEKMVLLQRMDAYCRQQTGQSLTEYSAQLMAEMQESHGPVAPQM